MIKSSGTYTLKYTAYDNVGLSVASVYSDPFIVYVGDAYQLSFQRFVGTAYGGTTFRAEPILAVTDRGGNIIASVNNGAVSATIYQNPSHALLRPINGTTAPFINGVATFHNLYINEYGTPYRLKFSTNIVSSSIYLSLFKLTF